jgi:hypothetical protein
VNDSAGLVLGAVQIVGEPADGVIDGEPRRRDPGGACPSSIV